MGGQNLINMYYEFCAFGHWLRLLFLDQVNELMNHQVSIEAKRKGDSHDNSFIKFIKITNNVKAKL